MFQKFHTGLMVALLISNPNTLRYDRGAGGEFAGPACIVDMACMDPDRLGVALPLVLCFHVLSDTLGLSAVTLTGLFFRMRKENMKLSNFAAADLNRHGHL